jgi:hypothetical protein
MDRKLAIPLIVLAALIDISCFLVSMRVPFQRFWVVLAAVFVAGTVIWVMVDRSWGARVFCGTVAAGVLTGWAVGATAWRGCPSGAAMIGHPDAWAYSALGRYLWYNPRGVNGGLSAIDQYASHMQGGRFATASLLDFISGFNHPGDAASAMMTYLGLASVALFLSVVFLSRCLRFGSVTSALAGLFVVTSGWFTNALLVANFDNVIFLAFFTTLIGLLVRSSSAEPMPPRDLIAATLLLAACFYTYPEGLAIGLVLASPLLLWYAQSITRDSRTFVRNALWLLGSAAVAAPYLGIGTTFLRHQISFASDARPGAGSFSGLLTPAFLPAVFAFGEEYPNSTFSPINLGVPLIMLAVLFVGCRAMWRRVRRFLLVALPLAALIAWQGYFSEYSYGLFKVIFCASWWYCPLLAYGIEVIAVRIWPLRRSVAIGALGSCLIGLGLVERWEDFGTWVWGGTRCIASEQQLQDLNYLAQEKAVVLNLTRDFDYLWAVYYLRDLDIVTPQPRSYLAMPHVTQLLAQARGSQKGPNAAFSLVHGIHPDAIWTNRIYSLIPSDTAHILKIENPNGLETFQGEAFVWVGAQPTRITVRTPCAGNFLLKASGFFLGPSVPELDFRTSVIETAASRTEYRLTTASDGIPIHLAAGTQQFTIWCSNPASVPVQPNGDPRSLMIGLKGYYLAKSSCD